MSDKKLARTTNVDGVTWLAGSTPPADVAERITNPKCWELAPEATSITDGVAASEFAAALTGGTAPGGEPDVNSGINASGSAATTAGSGADQGDPGDQGGGTSAADEAGDGELKGAALDKALEDAGLSKTGSVAQKRARLQEAQSGS